MVERHTSFFLRCATAAAALFLTPWPESRAQMTVYYGGEIVYQQSIGTPDSATFTYVAPDDYKPSQAYDPTTVGGAIADESEAVDLGLSVKWAPWNVGATSASESGTYFAWGEVQGKAKYDWSTYWWMRDGKSRLEYIIKYQMEDDINRYEVDALWFDATGEFLGDGDSKLSKEDDAASVNWGGKWRMPTADEVDELGRQCEWTWKMTGEYAAGAPAGFVVTGPSGNSIFLPAVGFMDGEEVSLSVQYGYYWTSDLWPGDCSRGYDFYIFVNETHSKFNVSCSRERYAGMMVRAVLPATE